MKKETTKPPGYIMCGWCLGTTYVFERMPNPEPNGPSMRMTEKRCDKCLQGFMLLDDIVTKN